MAIYNNNICNVPKVSPFSGYDPCNEVSEGVPGPEGPAGPAGPIEWSLSPEVRISTGDLITTEGVGAEIIPIWANTGEFEATPNVSPFGGAFQDNGTMMCLMGVNNGLPIKLVNSRTTDYGLWINSAATLFEGNIIQLVLVELGGRQVWLEMSRNF